MVTLIVNNNTNEILVYSTDDCIDVENENETKYNVEESELPSSFDNLYRYYYSEESGFYFKPGYEEIINEDELSDAEVLDILLGVVENE